MCAWPLMSCHGGNVLHLPGTGQTSSFFFNGTEGEALIQLWSDGTQRTVSALKQQEAGHRASCGSDLTKLGQGMPWRTIQDEFGKFKGIDHEGRVHQGTPYVVEPDATARTVFIASMMHAHLQHPMLNEKPDVTCPSDAQDNER